MKTRIIGHNIMNLFRKEIYDDANTTVLRGILRLIANHTEGFNYGNVNWEIDDQNFKVSEAERINEDEQWPKRSNPDGQVIFLDPEIYGGTENNPAFYILPPERDGWMALMDIVFPEPNACTPDVDKNILGIKNIINRASDSYEKLDDDPRLFLDPNCDNETPFAKIHSRESAASIEALVYVICRVHFLQYVLRTLSAFSKITPSFTNNLDDLFFEYVVQNMKLQMIGNSTSIGGRSFEMSDGDEYAPVPRYWLLFLEQCVQLYVRMRDNGKIEPTDDEAAAVEACQEAQNSFIFPTSEEIAEEVDSLASILQTGSTQKLAPYGIVGKKSLYLLFKPLRTKKAREKLILQRKMDSVLSVEDSCMVILKYFLKQESDFIADYLQTELESNSYFSDGLVTNLGEHFINDSDFMVGIGVPVNVGEYINGVITNPLNNSDGIAVESSYPENGLFIFEKYVRISPKDTSLLGDELQGVVNLGEFYETDFTEYYTSTDMISDHFGDLLVETNDDGDEELSGESNGISYGIRISYLPSEGLYNDNISFLESFRDSLSDGEKIKLRGLHLGEQVSISVPGDYSDLSISRYLFPLVSAEIDLPDMTIEELGAIEAGDFDDRLIDENNYLNCLKRKLLDSDEYKLMFEQLIPIRRHYGLISVFVSQSFINTIGSSEDGYNIYNSFKIGGGLSVFRNTFEDWDKEILTKTKERLKRLFLYQYNISDELYEDGDEERDKNNALKELFKGVKIDFNLNLKWWKRRRRIVDVCPDDIGET